MGASFIVRDHEGKVIAIMCSSMKFIIDPTMVEDYVAWKVVVFCRDLGLKNVILKGDALDIVNVLRKEEHSWSRYENLLANTKFILNNFVIKIIG
jgi:transcription initiation factor TFIIIB Brf1 subunit/transcription initiation factor TFIIB